MLGSFTVPLAVILFGSAAWTFALAMWRPGWLNQNARERLMSSVAEGLIWAVVWTAVHMEVETATSVLSGLHAGVAWAVPAYISRSRYQAIEAAQRT